MRKQPSKMPADLIRPDCPPMPPMSLLAVANAVRARELVKEVSLQEQRKAGLTQLVLSEISDFFAGIDQPGAPVSPEEMQAVLMARVESVMSGYQ